MSIVEYMYWKLWYSAAGVSQRLEFVFDSLDVDKSGYLTRDECGLLLTAVLGNCAPKVKDEWFDIVCSLVFGIDNTIIVGQAKR